MGLLVIFKKIAEPEALHSFSLITANQFLTLSLRRSKEALHLKIYN